MDTFLISRVGFLILISLIINTSCSQKGKQTQESDTLALTKKETPSGKELIHSVKSEHFFSSLEKKDTFLIKLIGEKISNSRVYFDIKNFEGAEIFHVEMEAVELLNYDLPPKATETDREKFIIKRMNEFFKESNFENPAINLDEKFDRDNNSDIDSITWTILKTDAHSIGFTYLIGEENRSWISYDKKNHVILKYKSCC